MPLEIERKFLVDACKWKPSQQGTHYAQAYLSDQRERTVRVRIAGDKAFLTIKGPNQGIVRKEFEYPIPVADARELMELAVSPAIEKIRYKEVHHNMCWEIDVFEGENSGLILAEVELTDENQPIIIPEWISEEVSEDIRYFNSALSKNPFTEWPQK